MLTIKNVLFINCEIHNLFILQLGKQILQQEHICNHLWFLILNSVWPHSNFANTVLKSTIFRHYCACPKRRNWGGKNTYRSKIVETTIQRHIEMSHKLGSPENKRHISMLRGSKTDRKCHVFLFLFLNLRILLI